MNKPPYQFDQELLTKASGIKLALFDVDGVLTDGSLYYGSEGETLKRFNVLDGHGLKMLQQQGMQVGIISAKHSAALSHRLNTLKIEHQFTGVEDKLETFKQLLKHCNISTKHTCFTGDDVIDIPIMQHCGLSFSVDNGHYSVKQIADWVTPMAGGSGAARAVCDILLYAKAHAKNL